MIDANDYCSKNASHFTSSSKQTKCHDECEAKDETEIHLIKRLVRELHNQVRIGILGTSELTRKTAQAIINPSSLCSLSMVELSDNVDFTESYRKMCVNLFYADSWKNNMIEGSYEQVINSAQIDAVYIPPNLATGIKKEYILKSLGSGKHILLDIPLSLSSSEYLSLLRTARISKKFIMDGAAFVHNHGIEEFLEQITNRERFGCIKAMTVSFSIDTSDPAIKRYISIGNHKRDGCIKVLGWICVRLGVLVSSRAGWGSAKSAKVKSAEKNDLGYFTDATCEVTFDADKKLSFQCSFVQPRRQLVEIVGEKCSASMVDFAFPNDIFSCFRIHETKPKDELKQAVEIIDSIDCKAGPPQDVMMWRNFSRIAKAIDHSVVNTQNKTSTNEMETREQIEWSEANSLEAQEHSSMSFQTQLIIDALMKSIEKDGANVSLSPSGW